MAVALINEKVHPAANPYFTFYPHEPIRPQSFVTVESRSALTDYVGDPKKGVVSDLTNLTTLVKTILAKAKAGGDVLIVMHGNDEGLFISLP
jgi:hypothetical protein